MSSLHRVQFFLWCLLPYIFYNYPIHVLLYSIYTVISWYCLSCHYEISLFAAHFPWLLLYQLYFCLSIPIPFGCSWAFTKPLTLLQYGQTFDYKCFCLFYKLTKDTKLWISCFLWQQFMYYIGPSIKTGGNFCKIILFSCGSFKIFRYLVTVFTASQLLRKSHSSCRAGPTLIAIFGHSLSSQNSIGYYEFILMSVHQNTLSSLICCFCMDS